MTDEEVLDLFVLYYPTKKENIVDQVYIGDNEYIFFIDDGSRVRFDQFIHCMTYIKPRGELSYEELDEIWIKEFSRKLKIKMKNKRITQKRLASEIGVSDWTIRRYMHGIAIPDLLMIRRISRVLECSVESLTNFDYMF